MDQKVAKLDQFYTKPDKAEILYNKVFEFYESDDFDKFIEPSCGECSFYHLMPQKKRIGIDLDPPEQAYRRDKAGTLIRDAKIIKMDFLSFAETYKRLEVSTNQRIIVIGNPPFGTGSSLAVKFFNSCALYCDVIAFIIPRTFKRISIQNKLDLNFHLVYGEDLPYDNKNCIFTHYR